MKRRLASGEFRASRTTAVRAAAEALERRLVLSVFLHHGAADPTTEGWQPLVLAGGGVKVGAVHDGSVDAWRIENIPTPQGGSISYSQVPTAAQTSQAAKEGWVLSARVRVPAAGQSTNELAAIYDDGTTRFQMQFGSNAAGDPLVTLPLPSSPITMSVPGAGETYNTFEIVHSPIAGSNGLFINGTGVLAFPGIKGTTRLVDWGDLPGGPGGTGDFNNVQFTAFSVFFTGAGDGKSWTDPKNWSTGAVPGPKDDVLIELPVATSNPTIVISQGAQSVNSLVCVNNLSVTGGSLSVAQPSELLGKLTLNGGAIGGAGDVTAFGGFSWGDGSLIGSGHFLLPAVATADLSGKLSLSREFDNAGTVNFTATLGDTTGTGLFHNLPGGQFNASGTSTFGTPNAILPYINDGNITRSGPGTTAWAGPVTSTGSVAVTGGTLNFAGAGNVIGGKVSLASGASFLTATRTMFEGATLTGAFNLANDIVCDGLTLNDGASITVGAAPLFLWGNQTIGGKGTIILADPKSQLLVQSQVQGTPATFTVAPGVTVQGQGTFTADPGNSIVNDGVLIALLNRLDVAADNFINAGTISEQQGGVFSFGGGVFIAKGGVADINGALTARDLEISGGTFNFDGSSPATLTKLSLNSGTLGGSGDVHVSSEFDWPCCGEIGGAGALTIEPGAVGTLAGNLTLSRELDNAGVVNFTGTLADGTGKGLFHNLQGGQFNVSGDSSVGTPNGILPYINDGTITRSGAGTTMWAGPITSNGIIAVHSGTLEFDGGGTVAGRVDLSGQSLLGIGGSQPFSFLGTSSVTGDGSVRKLGPGTLQLTASSPFTGGLTIADGTVVAGDSHALGAGTLTLDTSRGAPVLDTGVTVLLPAVQVVGGHTASLARRSTAGTLTADSLTIDSNSQFDLTNNSLQIQYGNNPDPLGQIQKYLASGYAGGTWKGPGLITSTGLALGYADRNNQVLIKPTVTGDADLDGRVTFNDLLLLAQHFGQGGGVWMGGDFNYDGSVTFPDLLLLAQHYNESATAGADPAWRMRRRSRT